MDIFSTNTKRCSRKKCNREIPPPTPGSKTYNTCAGCRATIAASKAKAKRKREEDGAVEGSPQLAKDGETSGDNPIRTDTADIRENISETTTPDVCEHVTYTAKSSNSQY
jgi:hypothetical protein